MASSLLTGASGYNDNQSTRYPNQSQPVNSNSHTQFDSIPFVQHDQQISNSHPIQSKRHDSSIGLVLGPPQPSTSFQTTSTYVQQSNFNPFEDWPHNQDKGAEDILSEEEIRIRSHEMLENEDMQNLLRLFSMGGHASVNLPEDWYNFPSYMPSPSPNFSYDEDRTRSGKAVVGWLKIRAAMRWGFFIRKKAAERRAQIVELEDE